MPQKLYKFAFLIPALVLLSCSKTYVVSVPTQAKQHCNWIECINDINNMPECQQLSADLDADEMAKIFFQSNKPLVRYDCKPTASASKLQSLPAGLSPPAK